MKNVRGFTIVELLIVVVIIAILAAITIVAYNGVIEQAKTSARVSEISQWKKTAALHKVKNGIECPKNYVFVYGNSSYGTSDFCVMKYEAKNVGGVATSQATGNPWVNINQTTALSTSEAACSGCHLISEAEWLTIAADVLSVKYNWSGGAVGSGFIYSGHNDNSPSSARQASTDDNDGYINTSNSETSGPNQKRTLYLTSGDTIWDLAGNVWEWTSGTALGGQPGGGGYVWRQWNSIAGTGSLNPNPFPSFAISDASNWTSDQGIGQVLSSSMETSLRAFQRGGHWGNGSDAGVFALLASSAASSTNSSLGFRVAR